MSIDSKIAALALDAIDIPLCVVDRDLRFALANKAYHKLIAAGGIKVDDPIGRPLLEVIPVIRDFAGNYFQQVFDTGEPHSKVNTIDSGGRSVEIEAHFFPIRDGDVITHAAAILRDVTDARSLADAVRHSQQIASAIMSSSTSIMILADTSGIIHDLNEPAAAWFGRPRNDVIGKPGQDIAPPDWVATVTPYFVEVLFTQKPARFQFKSGERILDTSLLPVIGDDDCVESFAIFASDITQEAQALERISQSEERFRVQFESIPVPTYVWELQGDQMVLVDYNPAAYAFTGGGVAHFMGKPAIEMHRSDPKIIEELFTCATQQVIIEREMPYQFRLSPVLTHLRVYYVPLPPNRVLVHTIDMTEQKQIEAQLRESREAYRDLVENVNDVLFSVDRDGILTYVSPAIKRILGYDPLEVIGHPIWPLFHSEDIPLLTQSFKDVLAGVLYPSEYRLKSKSGELCWVQSSSQPIVGPNGPVGLRGVLVDIATRKAAEEQLRLAHHELEARVEERTEELARANEQLQIERETLERKNLVLQELIAQIEESRHHAAMQILANIERVVLPIISHLEGRLDARANRYVTLLKQTLGEITAPFAATLDSAYRQLTPVEIEICNLIRRGYGSKQIAELRHSSVQTVVKQRKIIRRKLGIDSEKVSLANFLAKLEAGPTNSN